MLFYTHPGYSWKFLSNSNFNDYNCFIAYPFYFGFFFFNKGENKKLCTTHHVAQCQAMLSMTLNVMH